MCEKGPLLYIKEETSAFQAWKRLENQYRPKGFISEYLTLKEFFQTN